MTTGGYTRLPDGRMIVALTLTRPATAGASPDAGERVRILVHAVNRARALTRLDNLGLRAGRLRGNAEPPTADEVTAVLHHPDGLIWQPRPASAGAAPVPWRAIRALMPAPRRWQGAESEQDRVVTGRRRRPSDLPELTPEAFLRPVGSQTTGLPDSSTPASRMS